LHDDRGRAGSTVRFGGKPWAVQRHPAQLKGILDSWRAADDAPELVRELLKSHLPNIVDAPRERLLVVADALDVIDRTCDEDTRRSIRRTLHGSPQPGATAPSLPSLAEVFANQPPWLSQEESDVLRRWHGEAVRMIQGLDLPEGKELPEVLELIERQARHAGASIYHLDDKHGQGH
jgi:hypothetical protein